MLVRGKTYSGLQFNCRIGQQTLYKFTTLAGWHRKLKLTSGLNVDNIPFNPHGQCSAGGIYFTDIDNSLTWIFKDGDNLQQKQYQWKYIPWKQEVFKLAFAGEMAQYSQSTQGHCLSGSVYAYFRYVRVPDDARVYVENRKYKADKLILSKLMKITDDKQLMDSLKL